MQKQFIAPWQTPPNLCKQCKCSSWKTPWNWWRPWSFACWCRIIPADIRQALINNGGGHLNHALSGNWWLRKKQLLQQNLQQQSMQHLVHLKVQAAFTAATTRFGSGWAWLVVNKEGKLEVTSTANQTHQSQKVKKPILGLDVWEHAYYVKYHNVRPDYIKAFFSVINWNKSRRALRSSKIMNRKEELFFSFFCLYRQGLTKSSDFFSFYEKRANC